MTLSSQKTYSIVEAVRNVNTRKMEGVHFITLWAHTSTYIWSHNVGHLSNQYAYFAATCREITSVAEMVLGLHWPFLDSKFQQCHTKFRGCEKNAMTNVYKTFGVEH
jgi:hypothetical protein